MDEDLKFQRGDLDSVMAAHPHVAQWVQDFEAKYGSMYRPVDDDGSEGQTLWFGLEPQLTDEEENIRRTLIEVLLQEAPSAPTFTTDDEFENILSGMIDRYTILDSEARGSVRRQGRMWEVLGMDDKRIVVTKE